MPAMSFNLQENKSFTTCKDQCKSQCK